MKEYRRDSEILYFGRGCENCLGTGYLGRTGLFELLRMTNPIRELVQKRASSEEIKLRAVKDGMSTLRQDGIKKVLSGLTTISEVLRVTIE
jgi:type II secretory ATPase GspE/PulE/Tfp pilus assembly ATPase PilB-like protein